MMKIIVKGQKNVDLFSSERRLIKGFAMAVQESNLSAGKELRELVKKAIIDGPKTGRIYIIKGRPHQASAPGEAPANLSGGLVKSTDFLQKGLNLEVGYGAFYGKFLEHGTSKMAQRPNLAYLPEKYHRLVQKYFPGYVEKYLPKA